MCKNYTYNSLHQFTNTFKHPLLRAKKMNISKLEPKDKPYKPAEIHAEFQAYGITVTSWCIKHGFHRLTVVDLLRGKRIGVRGESHRAAVLLGLKRDPITKHINHPFKTEELAA